MFAGSGDELLPQPLDSGCLLLEVTYRPKRQILEDVIRQIALEAPHQDHRQKLTATLGTPAKLATKTGQHLGPGRFELGRDLDNPPRAILQSGQLVAKARFIRPWRPPD